MPTPRNDSYEVLAGASVYAGTTAKPVWMSKPIGEWIELPNTKPSAFTDTWGTSDARVINDYSGFGITPDGRITIHGGGHAGYQGNEVLGIDLRDVSPSLYTVLAPTPSASRVPQDGTVTWFGSLPNQKRNVGHTYTSMAYSPSLGKMLYFGLVSIYGGAGGTLSSDIFSLDPSRNGAGWVQTNDPTYQGAGRGGVSVCTDEADKFFMSSTTALSRFAPGSGWTTIATDSWTALGALVYDPKRNRVLRCGNYNSPDFVSIAVQSGTVTNVAALFNGTGASAIQNTANIGLGDFVSACYDAVNDRYLVKAAGGAFYAINPTTWEVTLVTPTVSAGSAAISGGITSGTLRYCSGLKALVMTPGGSSNFYIMRLA